MLAASSSNSLSKSLWLARLCSIRCVAVGAHKRQAATSSIVAGSVQSVGLSNRCRRAQTPTETTQALQGPQHPLYTAQLKRELTYVLRVDMSLPTLTYEKYIFQNISLTTSETLKLIDKPEKLFLDQKSSSTDYWQTGYASLGNSRQLR